MPDKAPLSGIDIKCYGGRGSCLRAPFQRVWYASKMASEDKMTPVQRTEPSPFGGIKIIVDGEMVEAYFLDHPLDEAISYKLYLSPDKPGELEDLHQQLPEGDVPAARRIFLAWTMLKLRASKLVGENLGAVQKSFDAAVSSSHLEKGLANIKDRVRRLDIVSDPTEKALERGLIYSSEHGPDGARTAKWRKDQTDRFLKEAPYLHSYIPVSDMTSWEWSEVPSAVGTILVQPHPSGHVRIKQHDTRQLSVQGYQAGMSGVMSPSAEGYRLEDFNPYHPSGRDLGKERETEMRTAVGEAVVKFLQERPHITKHMNQTRLGLRIRENLALESMAYILAEDGLEPDSFRIGCQPVDVPLHEGTIRVTPRGDSYLVHGIQGEVELRVEGISKCPTEFSAYVTGVGPHWAVTEIGTNDGVHRTSRLSKELQKAYARLALLAVKAYEDDTDLVISGIRQMGALAGSPKAEIVERLGIRKEFQQVSLQYIKGTKQYYDKRAGRAEHVKIEDIVNPYEA